VLAPLGEELLFRGGIYGGIQGFVHAVAGKASPADTPPPSLAVAGVPARVPWRATSVGRWLFQDGFAVLGSSLCFALMHADTAGGMGIVRVVSASVLGLSCGLARAGSGSLLAPLALHATFNLISLASLRGWLVFSGFPTKYTIPTSLVPLSLVLCTTALCLFLARRTAVGSRSAQ
jgi:membrane protease YdiL (CAAX protease family)